MAQNEAEFAGMVAHASAHVIERHATRAATRGELVQMASIPTVFVGGWVGDPNALPVGLRAMNRQFELQADALAAKLMSAAGYDPKALTAYIGRTQKDQTNVIFSAYPAREPRIAALEKAIATLPPAPVAEPSGDFADIQAALRR